MVEQETKNPPDKDITLHYIDKTYDTMKHLWESATRILMTETILSFLVICLSSGIVSMEDQVEISGLKFKIALWLILGGGSLAISVLFMAFYTLDSHSNRLANKIRQLYESLDYKEKSLSDPSISPFDTPNILISAINLILSEKKPRYRYAIWFDNVTTSIGVLMLLLLLPLGAEICAGVKVASSFGWKWWSWLPFAILVITTISSFITYLLREG